MNAANLKRSLRARWKSELTNEEIADEICMPLNDVLAMAASMGLPERTPSDCYLPTSDEIRLACAKIRAGWTNEEREARLGKRMIEY